MASSPTFTLPIFIFISMLFCPAPSVASGLNYLPPDFLRGLNTFSPPTLTSEAMGLSLYHLNVSVGQTSAVMIRMGVVEAVVKNTVYFKSLIAIYAISKVLLPIEMFGSIDVSPHPPHHSPPHSPPPPPPRSGQPPQLSPQIALAVTALSFLF
ncbi:unnamed protein product [Trifolium pratense]|uniref:Uncharacterized protein n=1 Tax=Trifolium pratense TaxID=57577 RepID=A0ACB0J0R3_TRIPR|nr:unnamed protein product [Trifolium pratense]